MRHALAALLLLALAACDRSDGEAAGKAAAEALKVNVASPPASGIGTNEAKPAGLHQDELSGGSAGARKR